MLFCLLRMRVSEQLIKEVCFTDDILSVQELNLDRRGVVDAGDASGLANVRSISLGFNALSSLRGLEGLKNLKVTF